MAPRGAAPISPVEGPGELLYKIDGMGTTRADAGDVGSDCYELEVPPRPYRTRTHPQDVIAATLPRFGSSSTRKKPG